MRDIATRWIDEERTPVPLSARPWIALALVCPAIFLCFFLVGRSTIPASAPHTTVATSLPISYGGVTIAAHLGSAPAIEAIAGAQAGGGSSHASTVSTATAQPQEAAVRTPAAATQPQASNPPAPTTSAPTPAAAPTTPTPARHTQPKKSNRVSFDTSG